MSDLTKRLRNKANTLCDEAANEIEALKAENVSVQFELDNMTTVAGDIQDLLDVSAKENEALKAEVLELQDFAIWMTGCGYDFAALPYFREQRDKLILNHKEGLNEPTTVV